MVVLVLASLMLSSCVASGPAYVDAGVRVGAPYPYYRPYYGPRYYGPRYYARPYYRPQRIIVDRPRYYNTPAPRPNYYHNNVGRNRSMRVR